MENLAGLRVAILIADGFEQVEMVKPRAALDQSGAQTSIVSPMDGHVRAWNFTNWGDEFPVDVALDRARPNDFDALLLPGGVMNPDTLRMLPRAVAFAKAYFDAGKPVAVICHGPWTNHRGRGGARAADRVVALAQDRSAQRRRRNGWTRSWWSTAIWCRAASPTTSPRSIGG
jgi:putative intracellular protease/amidase